MVRIENSIRNYVSCRGSGQSSYNMIDVQINPDEFLDRSDFVKKLDRFFRTQIYILQLAKLTRIWNLQNYQLYLIK